MLCQYVRVSYVTGPSSIEASWLLNVTHIVGSNQSRARSQQE